MRCYLGVNRYGAKVGIEGELAWARPEICRKVEILRLWNNIVGMKSTRLPKLAFDYLKDIATFNFIIVHS